MDEFLLLALIILAVGGIILAAFIITRKKERERTEGVRQAAERMGWEFRDEVPYKSIPDLDRFELFRTGGSKKIRNAMASPRGDPRVVVFDYSYVISTGKSSQTIRQTVFHATSSRLALPSFSLRPEHFFHRVAGIFGYQDIDLDRRPEFSKMFLLRGENEDAIRSVFEAGAAERFERVPGSCAAGIGHELLYWRPAKTVDADDFESWIRDCYELAESFTRAGKGV